MYRITPYKLILKEEPSVYSNLRKGPLRDAESVADFALYALGLKYEPEEYVYMLCFNTKLVPIGFFEVSHGTNTCSLCTVRSVFQKAMFLDASGIILVHNHPTGIVSPSDDDFRTTKSIKQAGELMEILLLDHIIVGPDENYYSFKQEGTL